MHTSRQEDTGHRKIKTRHAVAGEWRVARTFAIPGRGREAADYLVVVVVVEEELLPDGLGVVVVVLLVDPVVEPVPMPALDPVPLVEPVPEVSPEVELVLGLVVVELEPGVVVVELELELGDVVVELELGVVVVVDEVVDFSLLDGAVVVVVVVSLVLVPEDLSPQAVRLKAAIREANRTEYFMMFPFYKIKNKDVIVSVQKNQAASNNKDEHQ